MELFEAIAKRHSYRGTFTDASVSRDDLQKIVQAGIDAPSGCNAQTTSFIVVDDPGMLDKIRTLFKTPVVQTAKAMILCVCDSNPVYKDTTFYTEDCGAAVQNMLLAITGLGYATVWYEGYLGGEVGEKLGEILGVPKNLKTLVLLPIGVPSEHGSPKEKKSFGERAWFNMYGGEKR